MSTSVLIPNAFEHFENPIQKPSVNPEEQVKKDSGIVIGGPTLLAAIALCQLQKTLIAAMKIYAEWTAEQTNTNLKMSISAGDNIKDSANMQAWSLTLAGIGMVVGTLATCGVMAYGSSALRGIQGKMNTAQGELDTTKSNIEILIKIKNPELEVSSGTQAPAVEEIPPTIEPTIEFEEVPLQQDSSASTQRAEEAPLQEDSSGSTQTTEETSQVREEQERDIITQEQVKSHIQELETKHTTPWSEEDAKKLEVGKDLEESKKLHENIEKTKTDKEKLIERLTGQHSAELGAVTQRSQLANQSTQGVGQVGSGIPLNYKGEYDKNAETQRTRAQIFANASNQTAQAKDQTFQGLNQIIDVKNQLKRTETATAGG